MKDDTLAFLVNAYYDINLHKTFIPYLTGGVGIRKHFSNTKIFINRNLEKTIKSESTPEFVWNIGLGTKIQFNKQYFVDIEYRYLTGFKSYKTKSNKYNSGSHLGLISLIHIL